MTYVFQGRVQVQAASEDSGAQGTAGHGTVDACV